MIGSCMATDDCHTTNCYFFLCGQERRAQVQVHEETALNDHILLVLGSNTKLETLVGPITTQNISVYGPGCIQNEESVANV